MSLVNIHQEEGFEEAIAPYEVEVTEADTKKIDGSWQELIVRPPIPLDRTELFGRALVAFAEIHRDPGHNKILFIDHTAPVIDLRAEINRKLIRKV
jgi:hypothetical protein